MASLTASPTSLETALLTGRLSPKPGVILLRLALSYCFEWGNYLSPDPNCGTDFEPEAGLFFSKIRHLIQ